MKTVLITGGSGMVGRRLTKRLTKEGYSVIWLSRERYVKGKIPRYKWDYRHGTIDEEALERADYIIHLAGANLGDESWTKKRKRTIIDSRVLTAKLLFDAYKVLGKKPEAFISASAVGYYGLDISDNIYNEDDKLEGDDFLSLTCRLWEDAADKFSQDLGVRTVKIRTGFVVSHKSDALKKMMLPIRLFVGSPLGKGTQYFSWVHIDDLCNIYIKAIKDAEMNGTYNAVAPDYTTNAQFMRKLARAMKRPFIMPRVPQFVMRMVMGEAADMVSGGSRISSQKVIDAGFEFNYGKADNAIEATLKKMEK